MIARVFARPLVSDIGHLRAVAVDFAPRRVADPAAAAEPTTVRLQLDGRPSKELPSAWTDANVLLLARNGFLLEFAPQQAQDYRLISNHFRPFSQSEMRGNCCANSAIGTTCREPATIWSFIRPVNGTAGRYDSRSCSGRSSTTSASAACVRPYRSFRWSPSCSLATRLRRIRPDRPMERCRRLASSDSIHRSRIVCCCTM